MERCLLVLEALGVGVSPDQEKSLHYLLVLTKAGYVKRVIPGWLGGDLQQMIISFLALLPQQRIEYLQVITAIG
jgi:hypothetical protein